MAPEDTLRLVATGIARFGSFAAHAVLFGIVPALILVLRPAFAELPDSADPGRREAAGRVAGFVVAALALSAVCTGVVLVLQANLVAEFSGEQMTAGSFGGVFETPFGRWHLLRVPLLVGLTVLLVGRVELWSLPRATTDGRVAARGWWVMWIVLGTSLLATTTFSGHSVVASPRALAQANDLVHLLAGSIWFCGVLSLALVVPRAWTGMDEDQRLALLAPAVMRFSRVAAVAIAVVTLTGIVNSLLHVGGLGDLTGTAYGRSLAIKLLFFLGVLVVGGINHFVLRARLQRAREDPTSSDARRLFRKTIAVELALGLAIFAATAALTGSARTKQLARSEASAVRPNR
ncbi:MAG TPA: CopD family protein [Actinomycetota bacterium]|nr:CopD family protein [Actinomycetota bacterium]